MSSTPLASGSAASESAPSVSAESNALPLEAVCELTLSHGESEGGAASASAAPFVAAASGLVMAHGRMFVVADDQLSIGVFSAPAPKPSAAPPAPNAGTCGGGQMHLHPLVGGALPIEHAARKKQKPDWESLLLLADSVMPPHGALLAIPSGSAANRTKGSLCRFSATAGQLEATATAVDVSALFGVLGRTFTALNIEGGCVGAGKMTLFQRGNGAEAQNGIIDLDLDGVLEDLRQPGETVTISPDRARRLLAVELGRLSGVQLGFTDAFRHPQLGTWFLAAAEDTESTYADGAYVGSVLGRLGDDGRVQLVRPLQCPFKPEGLWIDGPTRSFFAVTDADDPTKPAILYRGKLPDEDDAAAPQSQQ